MMLKISQIYLINQQRRLGFNLRTANANHTRVMRAVYENRAVLEQGASVSIRFYAHHCKIPTVEKNTLFLFQNKLK